MMRRSSTNRGYSFAEMMVVMAIIALMMAVVVPRFAMRQKGVALKGASNEIMSALRTARRLAISERAVYGVVLDLNTIPSRFFIAKYDDTFDPPLSTSCPTCPFGGVDGTDVWEDLNTNNIADAAPTDYYLYTNWEVVGEIRALPENIVVVDTRIGSETGFNVTRTEDDNMDGTLAAAEDTGIDGDLNTVDSTGTNYRDPQEGNGDLADPFYHGDPVYRIIRFQPTGTADKALVHLWDITEERRDVPPNNNLPDSLFRIGYPPGLEPAAGTQTDYFNVSTSSSETDTYYYTLVVNPITGGVSVYDYAWGEGGANDWDRKKDGAS